MPDFTTTLPDTHFGLSQRLLKSLFETYRLEEFTGLLRLRFPTGVDLVSALLGGVQQQLYRCLNQKVEAIPQQSWSYSMDRSDASIASLKLTLEAMRLMRVAHEAPVFHCEQLQCSPQELTLSVSTWMEDSHPAILHVQSDSYNKIYLIAGHAMPVIEELAFSGNNGFFSLSNGSFPDTLSDKECRATRYVSDSEHEVWQEYELRFAFNSYMRMIIYRFSELAGRALTQRLCEKLSRQERNDGMNIDITMNGVGNHQYFGSFESARNAYLTIMQQFHDGSRQAIGARLVDRLALETMQTLGPRRYDLLSRHLYNKDALEDAARAVRRFGS
jgi:hypothetical protein